jgi:L-asparaginase II
MMRSATCIVEVLRGAIVESRHRVHAVVAHAEDGPLLVAGDPGHVSFVRSAIKMFQALPLVESGAPAVLGLTGEELALCTASHGGEPFHVAAARSILAKAGASEERLVCGPQAPLHGPAAEALRRAGIAPARIHNNCSGKHAGMLALAAHRGWPLAGYERPEHPVQRQVLATLSRWTGLARDELVQATDGCGLPTFALPLAAMAAGCARLAAAAEDAAPGPRSVVEAMTRHPRHVAGTDRLCTDLMRVAGGRLFAKLGAEGCYCAGVPAARLGLALKVEDGARRACEPALLAVLGAVGALSLAERDRLSRYAEAPVLNTRGEVVGAVRAVLS